MQELLMNLFTAVVTAAVPLIAGYVIVLIRKAGDNAAAETEDIKVQGYIKEIANAIADAVEGGTDFADAITAEVEDGEVTELVNVFGYNVSMSFPDAFGEWALDSAREAGDVGVVESENRGH